MSHLPEYVVAFCRCLRQNGFLIGFKEEEDTLVALQSIDMSNQEQFHLVLKTILCSSKEEQAVFDQWFYQFFKLEQEREDPAFLKDLRKEGKQAGQHPVKADQERQTARGQREKAAARQGGGKGRESPGEEAAALAAEKEPVKDSLGKALNWLAARAGGNQAQLTASISPSQLESMEASAKVFIKNIEIKQSRRLSINKKGTVLHGRRTMRRSLQTGGLPIKRVLTGRTKEKASFVLLCDGSRSMEAYRGKFLQFAYALAKHTRRVEVFTFSTRLRKVTEQIGEGRDGKLPTLIVQGSEWGGGTRIGESLSSFVDQYGPRLLRRDTVVMIASDGLDTGDISHLQWAMSELKRRSSAVVWLNPLLSMPDYKPEAQGMKKALPYIDIFTEAQSPEAFRQLAKQISIRR